ncbi:hypothetical protein [Arcanobacterium bovis]|uniref:Uncharacterized protein n=1 Tax=Arcanobacterium bovis TaxID=2529275 RepID=A0A4Q9UZK9_9ACTO|nr:hypothetical protein [Arcanobacterium bovis]TBW21463.1 hypothetical protein EZJ44_05830 [Arcanobacterium bovis]
MTEHNNEQPEAASYHLDDGEFAGLSFLYVRALLSIAAATFLAVGAVTAPWGMILVVMAFGSLLILGWPMLLNLPNRPTARSAMGVAFLLLIAAGIWGSLILTALAAAVGIVVVFVAEMLRSADAFRRLEQIAGTYLGITLLTSLSLWIHTTLLPGGIRVAVMLALVSGIVAIIYAFQSRTLEFVSLVNGVVVGTASALILALPWWSGIMAGIAVPLAFQLTQRAVSDVLRQGRLLSNIARSFVPFSALGMVALAIGLIVD